MEKRKRPGKWLLVSLLGLMIPLSGCFGDSNDKGDNTGSMVTPRPGTVQDANTAGTSKTPLPVPGSNTPELKPDKPSEAAPK